MSAGITENQPVCGHGQLILDLALEVSALRGELETVTERVIKAETARDAYRLVAVQGLHHAHDQHERIQRAEAQLSRLRDENRELRAVMSARSKAA